MLSIDQVRDQVAVVVPFYFDPSVPEDQIYKSLEGVERCVAHALEVLGG